MKKIKKIKEKFKIRIKDNYKRFLINFTIIFSILTLGIMPIMNATLATNLDVANIKSKGECGNLLIYKGILVKTYYAYYETKEGNYPAYCLDKTKQGVNDSISYSVSVEDSIHDIELWKYIINGYPYKTPQELGCANEKEAFTATKQAIYCYIHKNDVNSYKPIGEAGKRTLNALKKIVNDAKSSKETQISNTIDIKKINEQFKQDEIDKKYVSKIYEPISKVKSQKYKITINDEKGNLIEGIKITDINNKEKNEFDENEKFKILIPINQLKKDSEFNINIKTKLNTKPIYYGKAKNIAYQDYALTAATYEDSITQIKDYYFENKSNIKIIKQDKQTKEKIEGVEFEILDENKNIKYGNLKTNENGEINIKMIEPGTYYLRETKEKDGYLKDENLIKINIKLNENVIITVNNIKKDKPKTTINEKEIQAETKIEKEEQIKKEEIKLKENIKHIKKLPVTGM